MSAGPMRSVASAGDGIRTTDLLGALSLASDLALGLPLEHVIRTCYVGMRLADELDLPGEQRVHLYYAALLMDVGCTAFASQFAAFLLGDEIAARTELVFFRDQRNPFDMLRWLGEHVAVGAPAATRAEHFLDFALHGRDMAREGFRSTCEVAGRFAGRLGMPDPVQRALVSVFEQWDGSGPYGARGAVIPACARILYAASFLEVLHRIGGRTAAMGVARRKRGSAFDPTVVDAFLRVANADDFWAHLEGDSAWTVVQALEPDSDLRYVPAERLEDVALAFADFADLKSPDALGHSRRVAGLAERVARRMALPRREVVTIRLAGLLHDLGLVAVSSNTLAKPRGQLTQAEWERLRLHPYHAERILLAVPALAGVVPLVAAHHERFDGGGYPRGMTGAQIPLGARILAAADRFDELSHAGPGEAGRDVDSVAGELAAEAGRALCPDAVRALLGELGTAGPDPAPSPPRQWPAGLTDREVEIVRLLARGSTRRQVAETLVLSEHTVRHHLEHIYDKVGVGTRAAVTLFAVEQHLLD